MQPERWGALRATAAGASGFLLPWQIAVGAVGFGVKKVLALVVALHIEPHEQSLGGQGRAIGYGQFGTYGAQVGVGRVYGNIQTESDLSIRSSMQA